MKLENIVKGIGRSSRNFALGAAAAFCIACGGSGGATLPPNPQPESQPSKPVPVAVQENQTRQNVTNKDGLIRFIDSATQEQYDVTVVDAQDNALQGIQVTYNNGKNYEAFIATDSSGAYLPTAKILSSQRATSALETQVKLETVKQGEVSGGIAKIKANDQEALWEWQKGVFFTKENYERTINGEEKIQIDEQAGTIITYITKGLLTLFGVPTMASPDMLSVKAGIAPEEAAKRWDVYSLKGNYGYSGVTFIESNVPSVEIFDPSINEDKALFSWFGEDKTEYDVPFGLPTAQDLTIYLGPTNEPDLTYKYRLDNQEWQDTNESNAIFTGLPNGDHNLEVKVTDEVGNESFESKTFNIEKDQQPEEEFIMVNTKDRGPPLYQSFLPEYYTFSLWEKNHYGQTFKATKTGAITKIDFLYSVWSLNDHLTGIFEIKEITYPLIYSDNGDYVGAEFGDTLHEQLYDFGHGINEWRDPNQTLVLEEPAKINEGDSYAIIFRGIAHKIPYLAGYDNGSIGYCNNNYEDGVMWGSGCSKLDEKELWKELGDRDIKLKIYVREIE